jgi:hypothetical protein
MKETITSEIRKPNATTKYFTVVLQYIYSGKINLQNVTLNDIFQVLLLADEFIIPNLTDTCQKHISSSIGVYNVYQMLSVVSFYTGDTFRKIEESCLDFLFQYHYFDPLAIGRYFLIFNTLLLIIGTEFPRKF